VGSAWCGGAKHAVSLTSSSPSLLLRPIIFDYISSLLSSAQSYSILLIERAVVGLLRLCLLICDQVRSFTGRRRGFCLADPLLPVVLLAQSQGSTVYRLGRASQSSIHCSQCRIRTVDGWRSKDSRTRSSCSPVSEILCDFIPPYSPRDPHHPPTDLKQNGDSSVLSSEQPSLIPKHPKLP
jgi:hypothetical protein